MRGLQGHLEKYSKVYRDEMEREERKGLLHENPEVPNENGPEVEDQAPEAVLN